MKYLIDTHVIIWLLDNDDKLSKVARREIENLDNQIFVSIISLFEIVIKVKTGKLSFNKSIHDIVKELDNQGIELLALNANHVENYQSVPLVADHRDPFDRVLIATALHENLSIITIDEKFENYKHIINVIW
jgi:PIN domain nuclease of toxin-antitoxin system